MKIICAGMPKAGTKSMHVALEQLGYSVYDFPENFEYYGDDYTRFATTGWTVDDFRRMYENVDVAIDGPAFYFWEELCEAFPEAKTCPKEKLLVFNCKQGWEPLCKFLNKPTPSVPFPKINVQNELIHTIWQTPTFKRARREFYGNSAVLASLVGFIICKLWSEQIFGRAY